MGARSAIGTVEDTAANCLMLLTRVGQNGVGSERRVFTCKTCMKEFSSFQALGGHRASHKKPTHDESATRSPAASPGKPKTTSSSHACPVCGVEFPMGQALGGHMRRHRNHGGALVTRDLLPDTTVMFTRSSSNGKRVACLDLDLALAADNLNLKLELGRTVC